MTFLINISLITAFLAGVAALFAPCCITVLLPTYLASIFRQKRKIFMMTFFFFVGILVVFLPLGLGFGTLGKLVNQLHDWIYFFGGLLLIFLGASIVFGKHFMLPFSPSSSLKNQNVSSVFVLGIFSGLATICCAPVLAGVLTLSILPGSVFWGGMYAFVYVLGMTIPLFIIALFLDKINFTEKFGIFNKNINYKLFGKSIVVSLASFFAALMFIAMGLLILILNFTGNLRMGFHYQSSINIYTAEVLNIISRFLRKLPAFILPLLFISIFFIIIRFAFRQKTNGGRQKINN
jgi:cytochrome c-type biogenesis protein